MVEGLHAALARDTAREKFAAHLFDHLWDRYRTRVEYVTRYEQLVQQAGATFHNDHIAFRTFASQEPQAGIATLSRLFEAVGYAAHGLYQFPDKHLNAIHFQHPNPDFPKLFISELKLWELKLDVRQKIARTVASHRSLLPLETLSRIAELDREPASPSELGQLSQLALQLFCQLPWELPQADDVLAVNQVSQYAAWVLVHGYEVNHFTSLVNSHNVPALDDIEKTSAALATAGVPMKAEIEGQPGSKLRQTATEAVTIDVQVMRDGQPGNMPWTYAYFELAERNPVRDPETGKDIRFEGFLGPQATHLFEMTRVK